MRGKMTLRSKVIKLAYQKPELRKDLLPLLVTAALKLTKKDKAVLDAFIDEKKADSKKLSTNGKKLDGLWMGGTGIAEWKGGKIQLNDIGSKSGETVHRALRKMTPKNRLKTAAV